MLPLDRWPRAESVRFLGERRGEADDDRAADRVADALGDLPLALEQAARPIASRRERRSATTPIPWSRGMAPSCGESRGTWSGPSPPSGRCRSARSRRTPRPVRCCCSFAPFSRPTTSLSMRSAPALALPEPLKGAVDRPVAFNTAVGALLRYSLARRDGETLSIYCTRQRADQRLVRPWFRGAHAALPSGANNSSADGTSESERVKVPPQRGIDN